MLDLTPSSHNPHCTRDRCFITVLLDCPEKTLSTNVLPLCPRQQHSECWPLAPLPIFHMDPEIRNNKLKKKNLSVFSYLFYSTFASGSKESISLVAIGAATVSGLPCLVQGMRMVESNPLLSLLLSLTNQVPISNKQLLGGQTGAFRHSQAR